MEMIFEWELLLLLLNNKLGFENLRSMEKEVCVPSKSGTNIISLLALFNFPMLISYQNHITILLINS